MRKILLLITCLEIVGCASLPPFPEVWQCSYLPHFNKFRCVNTKTKEKVNLKLDDGSMVGAQCMSLDDFKVTQDWIRQVKEIAEKKCH